MGALPAASEAISVKYPSSNVNDIFDENDADPQYSSNPTENIPVQGMGDVAMAVPAGFTSPQTAILPRVPRR